MTVASTAHPNHNPAPVTIEARRLDGKTIFITGASSGIGAAAARRFVAEGADVVVGARRIDRLESLVDELTSEGGNALAVHLDVTDEASVAKAVQDTVERFGRLDGAVNNAALSGAGAPIVDTDSDYVRQVFDVNLMGVYFSLKYEIPAMLATGGGSIVNVSSVGGIIGMPNISEYIASKWGVIGMTKSVALEYGGAGVRVNAIAPGSTKTDMYDAWLPTPEAQAKVAAYSPMNQIALPDDMARVALFLLSEESRWTNGTVIAADGGQHVGCF
ncbi:SDR family NAD(P)-dependent oxidoreductase [Amycolatopsis pithecellobii]|uniref:Glucose 1-dehydrogenase n=1 Tax=Amycolatopsis pithecellobii TaxID=664692 RepID=A0A6N7Z538_9PSEU|nr:glucose 1-dehydrogenase [Amycolatopsis pithecellobii]MTD55560.1 glucose 1-dehydrogenase [Amycolatopsis pithecellobii]